MPKSRKSEPLTLDDVEAMPPDVRAMFRRRGYLDAVYGTVAQLDPSDLAQMRGDEVVEALRRGALDAWLRERADEAV